MTQETNQPAVLPTRSKFTPKIVEVEAPSGRTYALRELTGYEQRQTDAGLDNQSDIVVYRVVMAIDSVDGEKLVPRASRAFQDALLKEISSSDLDALIMGYARAFSPHAQADEIKNEPTPSD
jgi:hypothetical protein